MTELLTAGFLSVAALLGVALTLLSLPGIWFMALAALVARAAMSLGWWQPVSISWWTVAAIIAIAALAELIETVAGAAGAATAGGSRRAAFGAIAGGILGAILGTFLIPVPILGTLAGAVIAAGIAAAALELTLLNAPHPHADRPPPRRRDHAARAYRVGRGAAVGRLTAVVAKTAVALVAAIVLNLDAIVY